MARKAKRQTASQRKIQAAGHEVKKNPPRVLASTKRKFGARRAEQQRTAIVLNKARAAGARIPRRR